MDNSSLPKHLKDLLLPTALGCTKLTAAWDSLSPESQIQILSEITDEKGEYPEFLLNKIRLLGLNSPSEYIRHIAIQGFWFSDYSDQDDEDKLKIKRLIDNDPSPLVKNSGLTLQTTPEEFFDLPQVTRLTTISNTDYIVAYQIVDIISYGVEEALEKRCISELNLGQLVEEFVNHKKFKNTFGTYPTSAGSSIYLKGKHLEDLWKLVLKLPENASYPLIANLPTEAGFTTEIPKDVLNHLNERQLSILFKRSDVELTKFRKRIFHEKLNDEYSPLLYEAIGHNFDLTNKEFLEILKKPKKEKRSTVALLGQACSDLRPCIFQACFDFISTLGYSNREKYNIEQIEENLNLRYQNLDEYYKLRYEKFLEYNRDKEIIELKLYEMAKITIPWQDGEKGYLPSNQSSGNEELNFLDEIVVKGDTWATFIAFTDSWKKLGYREQEKIKKYLPNVLDENRETEDDFVDNFQKENFPEAQNIFNLPNKQQNPLKEKFYRLTARFYFHFKLFWNFFFGVLGVVFGFYAFFYTIIVSEDKLMVKAVLLFTAVFVLLIGVGWISSGLKLFKESYPSKK